MEYLTLTEKRNIMTVQLDSQISECDSGTLKIE